MWSCYHHTNKKLCIVGKHCARTKKTAVRSEYAVEFGERFQNMKSKEKETEVAKYIYQAV